MVGFLSSIFGNAGTGMAALGNIWYLVAFFILTFFVLLLAGYRISVENILFFILTFFLVVISYGLFNIPIQLIVIPIIFIILYISNFVYYYFNKQ